MLLHRMGYVRTFTEKDPSHIESPEPKVQSFSPYISVLILYLSVYLYISLYLSISICINVALCLSLSLSFSLSLSYIDILLRVKPEINLIAPLACGIDFKLPKYH